MRLPREAWACEVDGLGLVQVVDRSVMDGVILVRRIDDPHPEDGFNVLWPDILTGPARELAEALLAEVES